MSNKIKLTDEQKVVLYNLVNGIRNKNLLQQTLGGFAGTGKTTIIKYLTNFFPDFAVVAYTGKAANILRKKDIDASTIHSKIYEPTFEKNDIYFDLCIDPGCGGFIVDESSMVTQDIYEDLKSFNLPMIFVGDHGQLEPIDSKLNLMESPDYSLEKIHRNAGDIAKFAERLRNGFNSRGFQCSDGTVALTNKDIDDETLINSDQIICAFNKTRVETNNKIRSILGYNDTLNIGEKIMCLKNDRTLKLFNGMQGTVLDVYKKRTRYYIDFEFDNEIIENICCDMLNFGKETYKVKHGKNSPIPFDYAYCITAHKAQGDEWDNVSVIEQKCKKWSHKRWSYTAASRAKQKLVWKIG
jgi:ATP-dependent exoDNAse (exonuclease V) alpha subunit